MSLKYSGALCSGQIPSSSAYIAIECGLFVPLEPVFLSPKAHRQCCQIGLGNPGFAEHKGDGSNGLLYMPGVFVGMVDRRIAISVKIR